MAQCVHERVHTCAVLCHTLQRTNTTLQVLNCCVVQKLQKSAMKEVETMWACLHANNWKWYDQFERLGPDDCICCICFAGMEPCFFLAHLIFCLCYYSLAKFTIATSPLKVAFGGEKVFLLTPWSCILWWESIIIRHKMQNYY